MAKKIVWDTPTDGVSRKMFDRYKDQQVHRYVSLKEDLREVQKLVKQLGQDLVYILSVVPLPPATPSLEDAVATSPARDIEKNNQYGGKQMKPSARQGVRSEGGGDDDAYGEPYIPDGPS